MADFINRVLRPTSPDRYLILVNDEVIGEVVRFTDYPWLAQGTDEADEHVGYLNYGEPADSPAAAAAAFCVHAEKALDDFFYDIVKNDEPDDPSTLYFVKVAARGSGRLLEEFTTDDPYSAVEAARYAQAVPLEERWANDWEAGR